MLILSITLLLLAMPGHVAMCIWASNRLDSFALARPLRKTGSWSLHLLTLLGPVLLAAVLWHVGAFSQAPPSWLLVYAAFCSLIAVGPLPLSLWRRNTQLAPRQLLSNHTRTLNLRPQLQNAEFPGLRGRIARAAGNQSLELDVKVKKLVLPQMDERLEGLTIAHLSDLHFTGWVPRGFFDEVIEQTNQMQADLVAVTGDLLDKNHCLDWVPETLGQLQAPGGVYYVLGNHDRRVDTQRLQQLLAECGLVHLGGRWMECPIGSQDSGQHTSVLLAGNELPWFGPRPNMDDAPPGGDDHNDGPGPLRILLSHSPDQIRWAQQHGFDLMLAGHTHGGQIRIPPIGPIVAPSRFGVRYASGTFFESPTLMHVSQGLSGKMPLRLNCRPELNKLVLTRFFS